MVEHWLRFQKFFITDSKWRQVPNFQTFFASEFNNQGCQNNFEMKILYID